MATPHVAGTAALLKSFDFDLTVAGLKAALLGGVDPRPALTTKTVTGGRFERAEVARPRQSATRAGGRAGVFRR